jgi:endogenous inhibitor of DNA gyrase (YacG/DUF329 family)
MAPPVRGAVTARPPSGNPLAAKHLNSERRSAALIMDDQVTTPAAPQRKCPICGKPTEPATRPFCSPRCRDVDLNRWLKGSYVIPGRDDEADDVE